MSIIILQALRYSSCDDKAGSTIPGINPSAMFEDAPVVLDSTGGMSVICCCSAFFNVLSPRFAGFGQPQRLHAGAEIFHGVTQTQLKVLSTAPTFVYTPKLNYYCVSFPASGDLAAPEDAAFVSDLIRRSLPFLITFAWNSVADDQVISALLACDRLEHFTFTSNVRIDHKISELLRHRNQQVRDGVLDFFRNQLLTGTKNNSRLVNVPSVQYRGGWGGGQPTTSAMDTHPLVYAAERGHTNSVKMLLEFQDELLVMRAEQRANRAVELGELEARRAELKAEAEREARERSERRRLLAETGTKKAGAEAGSLDWTGGGWNGFGAGNNENNNNDNNNNNNSWGGNNNNNNNNNNNSNNNNSWGGNNNNNNNNNNSNNNNSWGGNNNNNNNNNNSWGGNNNYGNNNLGGNNNNNNSWGGNNNNNNNNGVGPSNDDESDNNGETDWNDNGRFSIPGMGLGNGGGDFGGGTVHPVLGAGGFNHNAAATITIPPPPEKLLPIEFIDLDILLVHAAAKGRLSTVTYLLTQGARVSGFSKDGMIAIDLAAEIGHVELVKLLHYAYVDQLAKWTSQHGETTERIEGGDVRLSMTKAKNINNNVEGDDETINSNQEMFQHLYKQHQDDIILQAQMQGWGNNGLLLQQAQQLDSITDPTKPERLLRVQPRKPFPGNPLIHGVLYPAVVSFLLTEGNNNNTSSSSSSSALFRCYDPLQPCRQDPTASTADVRNGGGGGGWHSIHSHAKLSGIDAIQAAIGYDAVDTVAILLMHCADIESLQNFLASVIRDALQNTVSLDMLRQLVLLGNPRKETLEQALISAVRRGTSAQVEFLLFEGKVDPNCVDRASNSKGETPLIAVIRSNQIDLVKIELLLRAGADCNKYSEPSKDVVLDDDDDEEKSSSHSNSSSSSSSSSSASATESQDFASRLAVLQGQNYGYGYGGESGMDPIDETIVRENVTHARVTPLAALFDFVFEAAHRSSPSSLYNAVKLLLEHGADPNVYIARPVSTPKSPGQRDFLILHHLGVPQTQMMAQLEGAPVDRDFSFLYEPLLHYLCRNASSAHSSSHLIGWNASSQLSDYSFLELVLSSSKVKLNPNLVVFGCGGTGGQQGADLQLPRVGSSCMAAAAKNVWKAPLIEKLVVECGGDVLSPHRKLSEQEQQQLKDRFGSEVAWKNSSSFLASRAEIRGGMGTMPQPPKKPKKKANKSKKNEKESKKEGSNDNNNDDDDDDRVPEKNKNAEQQKADDYEIDGDDEAREALRCALTNRGKLPQILIFENSGIQIRDHWDLHVFNASPLRIALAAGNIEGLTVMLKAVGKDALIAAELREVRDLKLAPLMHIAVDVPRFFEHRLAQVLQLLREYGANPDLPNPGNGRTLLNLVCSGAALRGPSNSIIDAIRANAKPSQMKIRLEQQEFDDVSLQTAQLGALREKYRAAMTASDKPGSKAVPFRLMYQGAVADTMCSSRLTRFLDSDHWNRHGWGGNVSSRSAFDLKNDRYPQLTDFYDGFTCSNCEKDLLLSRGLRRFCGGCFFVFCSECLNAEKNSRKAVDVADGKEKAVMLCRKCETVTC